MRTLLLVLVVILVAGCGRSWVQPGRSVHDANRDAYECLQQAAAAIPGSDWIGRGDMRDRCMMARGYEWR